MGSEIKKGGGEWSGIDDEFGSQGIYVSWRHDACNPNCSQQSPNKAGLWLGARRLNRYVLLGKDLQILIARSVGIIGIIGFIRFYYASSTQITYYLPTW